jgi:hypothetical protein
VNFHWAALAVVQRLIADCLAAECPQSEHEQFSHAHFSDVYRVVLDAVQHFDTAAAKSSTGSSCIACRHSRHSRLFRLRGLPDESVNIDEVVEVLNVLERLMLDIPDVIQKRWQARSIGTLIGAVTHLCVSSLVVCLLRQHDHGPAHV